MVNVLVDIKVDALIVFGHVWICNRVVVVVGGVFMLYEIHFNFLKIEPYLMMDKKYLYLIYLFLRHFSHMFLSLTVIFYRWSANNTTTFANYYTKVIIIFL